MAIPPTQSRTRDTVEILVQVRPSTIAKVQPATAWVSAMTVKAVTLRPTRTPADRARLTNPAACQIAPGT